MAELTIDRAIGSDITVSASYLYSGGSHLPTFLDTNLSPANSQVEFIVDGQSKGVFPFYRGTRPDANINNAIEVADIVDSTYNALVLQVNKRFNKGLLFNANYTWSKAEDTGQNSTTFISNFATMVDPFNNYAEKGPASFDRTHRLVASAHYAPEHLWGFEFAARALRERPPAQPDDHHQQRRAQRGVMSTQASTERRVEPRAVGHAKRIPAMTGKPSMFACRSPSIWAAAGAGCAVEAFNSSTRLTTRPSEPPIQRRELDL
jgi:hypothetical protein